MSREVAKKEEKQQQLTVDIQCFLLPPGMLRGSGSRTLYYHYYYQEGTTFSPLLPLSPLAPPPPAAAVGYSYSLCAVIKVTLNLSVVPGPYHQKTTHTVEQDVSLLQKLLLPLVIALVLFQTDLFRQQREYQIQIVVWFYNNK